MKCEWLSIKIWSLIDTDRKIIRHVVDGIFIMIPEYNLFLRIITNKPHMSVGISGEYSRHKINLFGR
jgi:hypothetical protein